MDCNSQLYINMGIRIGIKSETRYSISMPFSNKQERIIKKISTVEDSFLTTGAMRRYIIQVRMGVMRLVCKACFKKVEKRLLIKKIAPKLLLLCVTRTLFSMVFVLEQKRSGILLT